MSESTVIHISTSTMLRAALVVAGVAVLWFLKDIIAILFVALVLASALDPSVDWLERKRIPRLVGVLGIYIVLIVILSGIVALLVPPVSAQLRELSTMIPVAFRRISTTIASFQTFSAQLGIEEEVASWIQFAEASLASGVGRAVGTVTGFFGSLVSLFSVLIIALYTVVEEKAIRKVVTGVLPSGHQERVVNLIAKVERKIGLWLRGQIILGFVIFIFAFVGLLILRVPSALVLALFAGFMEFIPVLGPIVSAIPAVILGFGLSPFKGILVLVLYIIIQQVENHVIVPQVMRRALGLNPVIALIALLIGAKVAGIIGVLLAVPVATAVVVVIQDSFEKRQTAAAPD